MKRFISEKLKKSLLFLILLVIQLSIFAQTTDSVVVSRPLTLQEKLDSIVMQKRTVTTHVKQRVKKYRRRRGRRRRRSYWTTVRVTKTIPVNDHIGVEVWDLAADTMIYSHNSNFFYIPASNQKLFVGVAAIQNLGMNYVLKPTRKEIEETALEKAKKELKNDSTVTPDSIIVENIDSLSDENADSVQDVIDSTQLKTFMPAVLERVMKHSNNRWAERLMENLIDPTDSAHWSYEGCREEVRKLIPRIGGSQTDFHIEDGCGLSHSNRTTPHLIIQLLRYAYHHKSIFKPLYNSLPIAGVDGTLRRRMKGTQAEDNVRAKTGTVNGVVTLSGYLYNRKGHMIAFSIMQNNITSSSLSRHVQDLICELLAES